MLLPRSSLHRYLRFPHWPDLAAARLAARLKQGSGHKLKYAPNIITIFIDLRALKRRLQRDDAAGAPHHEAAFEAVDHWHGRCFARQLPHATITHRFAAQECPDRP